MDAADGARRQAVRRDPRRPDDGLVQRDLNQSLDAGGGRRRHRAADRGRHLDAAGAAGAAADARDSQQPVAARPRRSRRHARSAGRRGVSRAGRRVRSGQRAAARGRAGGHEAGAAGRTVAPHRDGRPADRRRRARDEESAQRDDHSSRAAEAEAGGGQAGVAARRDHRAGDPPARRSHPGVPEVRAARRSDVRAGGARAAAVERARCGPSGSAPRRRDDQPRLHTTARCWSKAMPRSSATCSSTSRRTRSRRCRKAAG